MLPSQTTRIHTLNATYLNGPQPLATLLYATPEWVIAQATKGYTGVYQDYGLTEGEQDAYWQELGNTKLKGPLEMATTFWLIQGVTRAFTHQLARYRLGTSMVQESQRFSVQDGLKARVMVPESVVAEADQYEDFVEAVEKSLETYTSQVDKGIPVQDARALLPQHICTNLYLSVNMAALAHIYEQRSCCQAQHGEWTNIIAQFKYELERNGFTHYAATLAAPWENPLCVNCGFGANFDRPCAHKQLFEDNLERLYQERHPIAVE